MARVLSKILSPINDVSLASEVVNAMWDTLGVNILLGACSEVLVFFETERLFDARFEHFTGLLTQDRMCFVRRLKVLLPSALDVGTH